MSTWRLADTLAECNSLRLDVARPELGVAGFSDLPLLGFHPPGASPRLREHYVRGRDLIAVYDSDPEFTTRVYWRDLSEELDGGVGCEWVGSVQTERLDSDPTLSLTAHLPRSRRFASSPEGALVDDCEKPALAVGNASGGTTILMAVPIDVDAVMWEPTTGWLRWRLVAGRLEKGVIRQSRVRAIFLPETGKSCDPIRLWRDFLSSPPVLTA